jgi:choline-sulfatase
MPTDQPNFLFIMADQLSAPALPAYGHPVVKAPHIDALARESVLFEQAYCNFPFCAPSRIAMLTGQLPSRLGAYDNGAEVSSTVPTIMHYLRARGYHTSLSGKMHFIGPDQLHGYEERLTTDIYPGDFSTTPDWSVKGMPLSGISFRGVVEAGLCKRNLQIDFDEQVHHEAMRKLYALGRGPAKRPFMLTVSYTHPHNPFNTTQAYWDRYDHEEIDLPAVPHIPYEARDPHSKRHYLLTRMDEYDMTDERIRMARHAYYGMVSYFDDKVGELLGALDDAGLAENTVVVLTADHGEMLGERGMWYKMCLFERAMRVPLLFRLPAGARTARRVARPVSHLDVLPTMLELAVDAPASLVEAIDGHSLVPLMRGNEDGEAHDIYAEYTAEGAIAPCLMVRSGTHKYIWSEPDGGQLFDIANDPHERENLAGSTSAKEVEDAMRRRIDLRWDVPALEADIRKSQRRRLFVQPLLTFANGRSWDYEPLCNASEQYVRGGKTATNAKALSRIPFVDPVLPDHPRASAAND